MNRQRIGLLASLFFFSGLCILAQEKGHLYESQISSVKIMFPGEPESRIRESSEGTLEEVVYVEDGFEYSLRVSKALDMEAFEKEVAKFGSHFRMAKKLVANFHGRNEGYIEGAEREDWLLGGYQGQKVFFRGRRYHCHYRAVILDSLVIEVFVKASSKALTASSFRDREEVSQFADSTKL